MILRVERYNTWKELVAAASKYEKQGISCEVRGWDDMRHNKLTVYGEWEDDS